MIDDAVLAALLDAHAPARPVPLCPVISAWACDDELPLWTALEEATGERLPAPFFGLVWPGAQLLATALTSGLVDVRGKRVADVGCGSGVAAVAAALAGAVAVIAVDVDPLACRAATLLAARHGIVVEARCADPLADARVLADVDVVLAGDLVYSKDVAARARAFVEGLRARGAVVALADAGRPFFDPCGLPLIDERTVEVPRVVDGGTSRVVRLYAQDAQRRGR